MSRPDSTVPLDMHTIERDLEYIIALVNLKPMRAQRMFDIVLRRNDLHPKQLNIRYHLRMGKDLDEYIRLNTDVTDAVAGKVIVHAIRSATNPVYRDVMCVRDAFRCFADSDEKLAIRMTRLHWHRPHWSQVKGEFMAIVQKPLIEKINGKRGLLRDVLAAMSGA